MYKHVSLLLVAAFLAPAARASTWYMFTKVLTTQEVYFFDRDTVTRTGEAVTVWIKSVRDVSGAPAGDGSYASAARYTLWCKARRLQVLTSSTYDKTGAFLQSSPDAGKPQDIFPDSVGEGFLQVVCAPDFPSPKPSGEAYFRPPTNDVFGTAKSYFEYVRAQTGDTAPK